ncbi:amidohydrolase family protein [Paraburkholderia phymatum]|uniref:Amidohydrolase family protein n=1 Tax=Paraburkholderia phymatum TaxID=148447 RepID=A0ACC6UC83_9BURK
MKQQVDYVITNGDIFTGDRDFPYISDGAIAVAGNRIEALGPTQSLLAQYAPKQTFDARGAVVHPGMIDTHIHATSIALHSLPVTLDQVSPFKVSYTDVKVQTDDEITEALTSAIAVAFLRRGYTCFMEAGTVLETDAFASALCRVGMRGMVSAPFGWDDIGHFATHAAGMISERLLERAPATRRAVIQRLEKELARNADKNTLVRGYVCLYGEGSATDGLTQDAYELAKRNGVGFNQHQGFIRTWYDIEAAKYGMSGVERLQKLGVLDERTTLTHLNVMSESDVEMIRSQRPGITWCPNNALHRGVHPSDPCHFPKLIEDGVCVSLGMDTTMYHPFGAAGIASLLLSAAVGQRLDDAEPFYMQTANAARNIGLAQELGALSVGKRADIVVRAVEDITHTPLEHRGGLLALSSSQIPVDLVMIDGRVVMQDGRVTNVDQDEVLGKALERRRELLKRAQAN